MTKLCLCLHKLCIYCYALVRLLARHAMWVHVWMWLGVIRVVIKVNHYPPSQLGCCMLVPLRVPNWFYRVTFGLISTLGCHIYILWRKSHWWCYCLLHDHPLIIHDFFVRNNGPCNSLCSFTSIKKSLLVYVKICKQFGNDRRLCTCWHSRGRSGC